MKAKEQEQTKAENVTLNMQREKDLKLFQRQEMENKQTRLQFETERNAKLEA